MHLLLKKFQPCIAWEAGWEGNQIWQKETWSNLQGRDVSKNLATGRETFAKMASGQLDLLYITVMQSCYVAETVPHMAAAISNSQTESMLFLFWYS